MGDLTFDPVFVVGGACVFIYALVGRRPFYNEVEMPLTPEEKYDTRPPTVAERIGYASFGILLVIFGLR